MVRLHLLRQSGLAFTRIFDLSLQFADLATTPCEFRLFLAHFFYLWFVLLQFGDPLHEVLLCLQRHSRNAHHELHVLNLILDLFNVLKATTKLLNRIFLLPQCRVLLPKDFPQAAFFLAICLPLLIELQPHFSQAFSLLLNSLFLFDKAFDHRAERLYLLFYRSHAHVRLNWRRLTKPKKRLLDVFIHHLAFWLLMLLHSSLQHVGWHSSE
mmetsp:Transcript_44947/g.103955  ORF Transcript_44947/g.103955 Transcript_44947/m.103955 type:complete len:211 (+) Transcript_44947:670-1302(+)